MSEPTFLAAYRGYLRSALAWTDLDALWQVLRADPRPWYVYAVGETPPSAPVDTAGLHHFITEVDALLRREHHESYCGIVYADNLATPSLIKVYDPNNLGSTCGPGRLPPPLPGWVLSVLPPVDLQAAFPPPAARQRWWQKVLGTAG